MSEPAPADAGAPLTCREATQRIYEFLDGELSVDLDRMVREHLAGCHRCVREFEQQRIFLRALQRRARPEKAPPGLRQRVLHALLGDRPRGRDAQ